MLKSGIEYYSGNKKKNLRTYRNGTVNTKRLTMYALMLERMLLRT